MAARVSSITSVTLNVFVYMLVSMPLAGNVSSLEIHSPTSTSVWVANGKSRKVLLSHFDGEYNIYNWEIDLMNDNDDVDVQEKEVTLFPVPGSMRRKYETFMTVPPNLETGKYRIRVCASSVKDLLAYDKAPERECNHSSFFHIEGTKIHGVNSERVNSEDGLPEIHERLFSARKQTREIFLRSLNIEETWSTDKTRCTIPKVHMPSKEEFTDKYLRTGKACIITGMMDDWQAMKKWTFINLENDARLRDGVYIGQRQELVSLQSYNRYIEERAPNDTAPWMIFMADAFEVYPRLRDDYTIPDFFSEDEDFMMKLKDDLRLDWRWILMAPKKSGSGWHVDPANTTGWLALTTGAKLWGMYPPSTYHIPGVKNNCYQKRDYAMDDAFNWWMYTRPNLKNNLPLECVQKPGEIMFIPSGWWHSVLNLDNTIAVTQNFCNKYSFKSCLTELKEQSDSDGSFIGSTLESLRELYLQSHPQFFDEEDRNYVAPLVDEGMNESQDREQTLADTKLFLSGKKVFLPL